MGMYKAAVQAAQIADERLSVFKRMIAEKEAEMAKDQKDQPKPRTKARVRIKKQD